METSTQTSSVSHVDGEIISKGTYYTLVGLISDGSVNRVAEDHWHVH